MYTPVSYGRIHFKHNLGELRELYQRMLHDHDIAWQLVQDKIGGWPESKDAYKVITPLRDRMRETVDNYYKEIDVLLGPNLRREKRFAGILGLVAGVFSFGLNIETRGELTQLVSETDELAHNQDVLIASLNQTQRKFQKIGQALDNERHEARHIALRVEARYAVSAVANQLQLYARELESAAEQLLDGFYRVLQGYLDPALISIMDVRDGITQLAAKVNKKGLKIVGVENPLELAFSLPVTSILKNGKFHMWISVPLVEEGSPPFQVLQVKHKPIKHEGVLIEFKPETPFLVVDSHRRLHADVSAAELADCLHHRSYYFCGRTEFSSRGDSCSMALYQGDKPGVLKNCKKFIQKAPLVVAQMTNSSERIATIYTAKPVAVHRVCPHGPSPPTVRVTDPIQLHVPQGCHIEAEKEVIFLPYEVKELEIASKGEVWEVDDLLPDIDPIEIKSIQKDLQDKSPDLLHELKPVKRFTFSHFRGWWKYAAIVLGALVVFAALELLLRYCCACKRVCSERKQEGSQ